MKSMYLRKGKTLFVVLSLSLFLVFTSFLIHLPSVLAVEPQAISNEILEGAKKEGKLLWYTTSTFEVGNKILGLFREKYPFIKQTSMQRFGSAPLLTKVLAEAHAKKYVVDVVMLPGGETRTMMKNGLYAGFISPQSKFTPDGYKDPEGYWTTMYRETNGLAYNTKLVSPQEVPSTWNDLLNPKWKGKIGIDTKSVEWFGYVLKMMGQNKGLEYMKKLSEQNIKFYPLRTVLSQLVAAAELSIALTYRADIEMKKDQGAPLEWVGIEPIIQSINTIGIFAHAPHPNAAKLFVDFALSREGMEAWASVYRDPVRPDVQSLRLKKGLKFLVPDFAVIDAHPKNFNLYREILMKR